MHRCHSRLPQAAHRPTAHRRGFNLAELLFVISAISALTVLVMTVIGLLITAEQHAAEALWIDLTVSSFATDLRQDAHQALELEAAADEQGRTARVSFLLPEATRVTYECTSEGVVRRQTRDGEPEATETYRLALGSSTFRPGGEDGLLIWTHLREIPSIGGFGQPPADSGSVQRTFHVQTVVGLHAGNAGEEN